MPSYAILGATGNVGQSLIQILSKSSDNRIHAYARSRQKLLSLSPYLQDSKSARIFEGALSDVSVIKSCIAGVDAVFLAVALNTNQPGATIAQDTAQVVVAALQEIRAADPTSKLPRLVVLSSSSTSPHLERDLPAFGRWLIHRAASYIHADLMAAEKLLRSREDWLSVTFVKPGGLVHDTQKGHEVSMDRQQTFLSFLDLAAGMIEVADEGERYAGKEVSVVPTAKDVKVEWRVPFFVLLGLLCHYFPWMWPYLKNFG